MRVKIDDYILDITKGSYGDIGKVTRINDDIVYAIWLNGDETVKDNELFYRNNKGKFKVISEEEALVYLI